MAVTENQSLSIVSTNSSNNTAIVRYVVTCTTSGESHNNNTQTGTFIVDGTKYTNSYTLPGNSTTTVFNRDITISNASGKNVTASYSFPTTPYYGTKTGNTSVLIPTLVQAPTINSLIVKSRTLNSITFSFTCTKANNWYYKLSTSSAYSTGKTTNVTSGEFTISNLKPNTTYTVNFIARNWAGSTAKDNSKNVSGTCFDIGKISSVNNFDHGSSTNVAITNPSR